MADEETRDEYITCPSCNEQVSSKETSCSHCGKAIKDANLKSSIEHTAEKQDESATATVDNKTNPTTSEENSKQVSNDTVPSYKAQETQPEQAAPEVALPAAQTVETKKCPSCKYVVPSDAIMCYACGYNFSGSTDGSQKKGPNSMTPDEGDWQLTEEDITKLEQRLKDATRKLRASPLDSSLWLRRASILMELKRYHYAIKAYNRAIHLEPTSIKAWSAKAYATNKIGDQKEAAKCYKKAMELGRARSLDIDQLLHATEGSANYKDALDKALNVLVKIESPSNIPIQNQQRCARCNSYKIKALVQNRYKCFKCGYEFQI